MAVLGQKARFSGIDLISLRQHPLNMTGQRAKFWRRVLGKVRDTEGTDGSMGSKIVGSVERFVQHLDPSERA
jgi:hypothetical protein